MKGNPGERIVAAYFRQLGCAHASLRHEPGAGDHIVSDHGVLFYVETKANIGSPWAHFRPRERAEVRANAVRWDATPLLAHVLPGATLKDPRVKIYEATEWPKGAE